MMKDAEQYKAEDEKRKEAVEVRNQGDALVYQVDKTLSDLGDKVQAEEKSHIEKAKEELKSALSGTDVEEIKAKSEALSKALYAVTERLYKETGAQQQAGPQDASNAGAGAASDDNVVDADYTVVDDDKK